MSAKSALSGKEKLSPHLSKRKGNQEFVTHLSYKREEPYNYGASVIRDHDVIPVAGYSRADLD